MRAVLILALSILAVALGLSCARPVLHVRSPPAACSSWGSLPLAVALDASAAEYRGTYELAFEEWERALGRPAFVWADVSVDVVVEAGPVAAHVAATATTCRQGRPYSVTTINRPLDSLEATLFAMHELGHALGLGESEHPGSIMRPAPGVALMSDEWEGPLPRILALDAHVANALHPR